MVTVTTARTVDSMPAVRAVGFGEPRKKAPNIQGKMKKKPRMRSVQEG